MRRLYIIRCILSLFLLVPLTASASEDTEGVKLENRADSLYGVQQYAEAQQMAEQALVLLHDEAQTEAESDCLNLLALIHVRKGEFDEAVKYARRCYEMDLKSGDTERTASSLNTLAGIYMTMRQPQEAEKYILKGIDYARQTDNPQRLAVLYGMASEVYHHLKQEEQALDYATRAYELEQQLGRKDKAAIRQAERASALIALQRHAEARQALDEAIPGLRESGNIHSLGIACNQMGLLMHQAEDDSAAVRYYNEALQIFIAQHDLYNESRSRKGLYDALRKTDPALAMEHNDRYNELRDSIYDKDTGELLSKYAAEYGLDELQSENRQMHRYITVGLMALAGVFCLGAILIWWLRRRQHQRMEQLIRQIEELKRPASVPLRTESEAVEESGESALQTEESESGEEDHRFLIHLVEVVNASLPTGHYGVEQIAQKMNMSVQTFRRRLLSATGESPKAFISAIQMERAAKLLTDDPDMPVARVATLCGYDETNSFGRSFKRFYSLTPSQYREKNT